MMQLFFALQMSRKIRKLQVNVLSASCVKCHLVYLILLNVFHCISLCEISFVVHHWIKCCCCTSLCSVFSFISHCVKCCLLYLIIYTAFSCLNVWSAKFVVLFTMWFIFIKSHAGKVMTVMTSWTVHTSFNILVYGLIASEGSTDSCSIPQHAHVGVYFNGQWRQHWFLSS